MENAAPAAVTAVAVGLGVGRSTLMRGKCERPAASSPRDAVALHGRLDVRLLVFKVDDGD